LMTCACYTGRAWLCMHHTIRLQPPYRSRLYTASLPRTAFCYAAVACQSAYSASRRTFKPSTST
jgi:hypothetical protein